MSNSEKDYLKRADLIRKRLMERAAKVAKEKKSSASDRSVSSHRPGSLTQKLKPILGKIDELTEESREMNRRFKEDSKSGEFKKEKRKK